MTGETTPLGQVYRAYERFEGQLSEALDRLVATNGFADLLATSATNVMALTRLANGTVDRFVRSTRLAARRDVTDVARQLARTEEKLERLLQAVEELEARLVQTGEPVEAVPAIGTAGEGSPEETTSERAGAPAAPAGGNGSASRRRASASVARAARTGGGG